MERVKPPGHGHLMESALHGIHQSLLPVSSRKADTMACTARSPARAEPGASEKHDKSAGSAAYDVRWCWQRLQGPVGTRGSTFEIAVSPGLVLWNCDGKGSPEDL